MPSFIDILQALNGGNLPPLPDPAKPMGLFPAPAPPITIGPPQGMPDAAPMAPTQPLDMNFVNQYAGQAPVAPVASTPTTLDKVAAILGGIAYGPQYAQMLQEQRQAPLREYQRQSEQYQNRKAQGLELATRKQERQQEQAQRQAEANQEREFKVWLQKTGVTDEVAIQQMRQAFEIQKIREQQRAADAKLQEQQRAQQERDARLIARDYGRLTDNPKIALELGRYYAGLTDNLSPQAAKFESVQNRLNEARALRMARLAAGGGGGGAQTEKMAILEDGTQVPASKVTREGYAIINGEPKNVVGYQGGKTPKAAAPKPQPKGNAKKDSLGIR